MSTPTAAPAPCPPEEDPAVPKTEDAAGPEAVASDPEVEAAEAALPPLSPADFREYNRLAEHMDLFHNHFRQTWTQLHSACVNNRRPANLSLRQFIDEGLYFVRSLTAHHNIEEMYFFPLLAAKMPEFSSGGKGSSNRQAAELLQQHKEIHAGMDVFEDYLRRCRNRETELELSVLKEKMDSWGEVLWKHLDQEVKTLGAENMRKYWTLPEMRRLHT